MTRNETSEREGKGREEEAENVTHEIIVLLNVTC